MNRMNKSILAGLMVLGLITAVTAAQDVDDDGLYEDVNGDGVFNIEDVYTLFEMVSEDETSDTDFDFNEDGQVTLSDVTALYDEGGFESGELSNSQDIDGDGLEEDINGDGSLSSEDVEIFFDSYENTDSGVYDFNGDGNISINDVQALYVEVGADTSPVVGNATPEDGAVIESTYSELEAETVDLSVDASDPAKGDVNVTFYTEGGDVIGSDTGSGPGYSFAWDVNEFREYSWYAVAEDEDGNETESSVRSFEVSNSDDTAPSVNFDSTPDDPTLNRDVNIQGTLDEDAKLDYRVDGGQYSDIPGSWRQDFDFNVEGLSNGDHTITVRAEDRAGNTGTNSFSFKVADGSEVSFQVSVEQSYPQSGIPIDPDSDVFDRDANVDFDFSLERNGNSYDISNNFEDGICDFRGDDGWQLGNDYFCGSKVPESIPTGVNYDLVAEWDLRGESHREVLDSGFQISETSQWYSQRTSHGGRVEGSVDMNPELDGNFVERNQKKIACTGSSYEVNNINSVTARCSNGVTSSNTPPVVSFVTKDGESIAKNNNDMFNDPDCNIEDGVTRQELFGEVGTRGDEGYYPPGCSIGWTLGGDTSFTAYTFNQPGEYDVSVDYVNAVSDSPNYICPADPNNDICDLGSISPDRSGWENVKQETVKVINPDTEITESEFSNSETAEVNGNTYVRREDYSGDIEGTIDVENTGTGNIEVTDLSLDCPSGVDCEVVSNLDLVGEISGGETSEITWSADPNGRTTGEINVELRYQDIYGLGCSTTEPHTETYYLDEAEPETGEEEVN